jgi:ribosome-binding protein aMBF1 (putative translation factor)
MANHPRRAIVKDWPKYLRDFRDKHGLSQKELADKLMVSHRLVENWEGAVNTPPPYLKIALNELEDQ